MYNAIPFACVASILLLNAVARSSPSRTGRQQHRYPAPGLLLLASLSLTSCDARRRTDGEVLAQRYCTACHAFPDPRLLDKKTWQAGVLPQMAPRLGVVTGSLYSDVNPNMATLASGLSVEDWAKIVAYYAERAPDALPGQPPSAQPRLDPPFFRVSALDPRLQSSAVITLLEADQRHARIFVGEAGSNMLRIFDWKRRLLSSLRLSSPPTDVIIDGSRVLLLESGILEPNDAPRGRLVEYAMDGADSLRFRGVVIDSLFRPVFARQVDFEKDGRRDLLICEYGNNRGRLALYHFDGSHYHRQVLDPGPGAIRFAIRDMTGDGAPDIVALFGQGDERIVLFENDGKGSFTGRKRVLARFPPVYGSMYFSLQDFNGDGSVDILYVNGDNFDFSRVLKPYHGVRILENDGQNNFRERFFFPMYGAARAEVADFDKDGDLDIVVTSNFADSRHPERGIQYLENIGAYEFRPYAFTMATRNQWNLIATADLNSDGRLDVIIGAMDLKQIQNLRPTFAGQSMAYDRLALLVFENGMPTSSPAGAH